MPDRYVLDFEEPLNKIRQKIKEMESWSEKKPDYAIAEIKRLEEQEKRLSREIYSNLTNWQRVQVSRHPNRPYTLDYIDMMMTDFTELHGDRYAGDDPAMVAGFAKLDEYPLAVIGQQKGRDSESRVKRNFGMPNPEGYRKALRIMKLAEKFSRPVVTFIDTPGAFPGIMAEEKGQGEAIARNLMEMSHLGVPIIVIIIGEGGSGGALGIGIGDRIIMLENAWYSVIAPESCSTILMRNTEKKDMFAESLKLSAPDLKKLGIIDIIIPEPVGGAHNNPKMVVKKLKSEILSLLKSLKKLSPDELVSSRIKKFKLLGRWSE
ncbi:MAG: acetyl-CoA carboxylase carboxyltransferase subunit alpha [Candidatus Latescibacteria bacterium]|jgi:acetyl-CoA carboxylase carboxyl transferase subunit alpha|nr:acetyl-CoA carboxylase carboxyltransferase subunit alpha [Candidatus Latescibacterota bacterium]